MKNTKHLVLTALFLALGIILPFLTGQIPEIGSMLLPMHLPVLLCGFVCGWPYGLAVGFITPLPAAASVFVLRSSPSCLHPLVAYCPVYIVHCVPPAILCLVVTKTNIRLLSYYFLNSFAICFRTNFLSVFAKFYIGKSSIANCLDDIRPAMYNTL